MPGTAMAIAKIRYFTSRMLLLRERQSVQRSLWDVKDRVLTLTVVYPDHQLRAKVVLLTDVFEEIRPFLQVFVKPLVHGAVYTPGSSTVTE